MSRSVYLGEDIVYDVTHIVTPYASELVGYKRLFPPEGGNTKRRSPNKSTRPSTSGP